MVHQNQPPPRRRSSELSPAEIGAKLMADYAAKREQTLAAQAAAGTSMNGTATTVTNAVAVAAAATTGRPPKTPNSTTKSRTGGRRSSVAASTETETTPTRRSSQRLQNKNSPMSTVSSIQSSTNNTPTSNRKKRVHEEKEDFEFNIEEVAKKNEDSSDDMEDMDDCSEMATATPSRATTKAAVAKANTKSLSSSSSSSRSTTPTRQVYCAPLDSASKPQRKKVKANEAVVASVYNEDVELEDAFEDSKMAAAAVTTKETVVTFDSKVVKEALFSDLTPTSFEQQRLADRAARYGMTATGTVVAAATTMSAEQLRLAARAAKFGMATTKAAVDATTTSAEQQRIATRAAKFGMTDPTAVGNWLKQMDPQPAAAVASAASSSTAPMRTSRLNLPMPPPPATSIFPVSQNSAAASTVSSVRPTNNTQAYSSHMGLPLPPNSSIGQYQEPMHPSSRNGSSSVETMPGRRSMASGTFGVTGSFPTNNGPSMSLSVPADNSITLDSRDDDFELAAPVSFDSMQAAHSEETEYDDYDDIVEDDALADDARDRRDVFNQSFGTFWSGAAAQVEYQAVVDEDEGHPAAAMHAHGGNGKWAFAAKTIGMIVVYISVLAVTLCLSPKSTELATAFVSLQGLLRDVQIPNDLRCGLPRLYEQQPEKVIVAMDGHGVDSKSIEAVELDFSGNVDSAIEMSAIMEPAQEDPVDQGETAGADNVKVEDLQLSDEEWTTVKGMIKLLEHWTSQELCPMSSNPFVVHTASQSDDTVYPSATFRFDDLAKHVGLNVATSTAVTLTDTKALYWQALQHAPNVWVRQNDESLGVTHLIGLVSLPSEISC